MMLALLSLLACSLGGGDDEDEDEDEDEESILGPDQVVVDDQDDGLHVEVTGGTATGWRLGVAWRDQEYSDETCDGGDTVCHPLETAGGTVSWCDQHEGSEGCTGIPRLYYRQGQVSFVIRPEVGVGCWSWGDEASSWEGCDVTGWDPSSY